MSPPHASTLPSGISCVLRLAAENDLQQICDVFQEHAGTPAQKNVTGNIYDHSSRRFPVRGVRKRRQSDRLGFAM